VSVVVGELLLRRVVGVDSDCVVFDRAGLGGWDYRLLKVSFVVECQKIHLSKSRD